MSPGKPKFYLTTPIYYTNGLPHIGHTYTTVVADTIRRYKRMRGYELVMTTGTDEHGVNVERAAKKAGMSESAFVAQMAAEWRTLWDELGLTAIGKHDDARLQTVFVQRLDLFLHSLETFWTHAM